MLLWPSMAWTDLKSAPFISKSVANEWRKVCGLTCLVIPAKRAFRATMRWTERTVSRKKLPDISDCLLPL